MVFHALFCTWLARVAGALVCFVSPLAAGCGIPEANGRRSGILAVRFSWDPTCSEMLNRLCRDIELWVAVDHLQILGIGRAKGFAYSTKRPYWLGGGGGGKAQSVSLRLELFFEVETMAVRGCPLGFPWFP